MNTAFGDSRIMNETNGRELPSLIRLLVKRSVECGIIHKPVDARRGAYLNEDI